MNLSYIAGFFDGEGSVTIQKQKYKSRNRNGLQLFLYIKISNIDKDILEKIRAFFGTGYVCSNGRPKKNQRKSWQWQASATNALLVLKKLRPFMILKTRQVDLAIQFQERLNCHKHRPSRIVSIEELSYRKKIKAEISALNKGQEKKS
jgi:hypothetical protein